MNSSIPKVSINNKTIYGFNSKEEFLDYIKTKKNILIALNAEKLNKNDTKLNTIINDNIGYCDGVGAVFALKLKGVKSAKIAGAEFWLDIIERYSKEKSFYLIGSKEAVIQKTVDKLKKTFPEINIVGYRNGYLKNEEINLLLEDFKSKKPDVVFVAMGSPKQEYLMQGFLKDYKALYMGLGGSFDVYAGTKKRAPKLFIKLGLEWFYRLLIEPKRIFRQLSYFEFAYRVLFKKI